ncbi:MAG: hypothetical protein ABW128_04870, partial [Rhizorhabdus sp.]
AGRPKSKTYSNRFGGLVKAYKLIGYDPARADRPTDARAIFAGEMMNFLMTKGVSVIIGPPQHLTIEERYVVALSVCSVRRAGNRDYWAVKQPRSDGIDLVLVALMRNTQREAIYLLPSSRFGRSRKIEISGASKMSDYEVWNMDFLPEMIRWHGRNRGRALHVR